MDMAGNVNSGLSEKLKVWVVEFLPLVHDHIWNVRQAGKFLDVPESQLYVHDQSKYSEDELPHYARQFVGDKGDSAGFAGAWLHHQNVNPHHWEYWIMRSDHSHGGSGAENGCLEMPENYAREMVADWLGASMSYTGTWDMADWITRNLPKIKVHPNTKKLLHSLLSEIGYKEILAKGNY